MDHVAKYIVGLLRRGQHNFTAEDVEDVAVALGKSREAVVRTLARLAAKGELAAPGRGPCVAVPGSEW